MTRLDKFNECVSSKGYKRTRIGVSWKVVGECMYFQPSREAIDWVLNLLSAIPFIVIINRRILVVPLGAALGWWSIRKIVKKYRVSSYCGVSQGGWWASFSSFYMWRPAITFGCPNLYFGDAWAGRVFNRVLHIETPTDIVTRLPTWGRKGRRREVLGGQAIRPDDISIAEWITGHVYAEYRQRMMSE